ncbi:pilus assembly protein PilY [Hyalangium minutum]|uniref:Type IV fimbrial biogenesis protein PilY1 n=1 Tax=Hyalangium minutum TaxID=394096 RepID=A0A085W4L9_9BACT|nr:pilus assembly protein PilY [Hyalangium minutum]KFE62632.1 hypothetical protein DB31_3746 [Hyalangium minutum]
MKRLCLVLVLLAAVGPASAQLGSSTDSPACCQLTTSLIQDVVYGKDAPGDERALPASTPANLHILIDNSGSMRELPQVTNSDHTAFFNLTVNGCENPRLDAFAASRGWDPNFRYPPPDLGTGLGSDTGFPNLFQDNKFYGYLYWADLSNPPSQWDSKEQVCQSRVANWSTTGASEYFRCLTCLSTKGYYKVPGTVGRNTAPLENLNFIFWGRYLNFNPPKYVTLKAVLKSLLKDVRGARVGLSYFSSSAPNTVMLRTQNPSCQQVVTDSSAFDSSRASYINAINTLAFNTGTPLARSLLNVGYYFTSDDTVYRDVFGFGTGFSYPSAFKNSALSSQNRSVCWGCQTTSVIIISDGEPNSDTLSSTVVTKLRTLNNGPVYCPDSMPCGPGTLAERDKGSNPTVYTDDNPNYLLDDVAKLLYEQDLQRSTPPIVGDFNTAGKQSVATYTVGFGINSNLLRHTAEVGGGLYYIADDAASLSQALRDSLVNVPSTPNTTAWKANAVPSTTETVPAGQPASALVPRLRASVPPNTPWQGALYRFQLAEELLLGCDPLSPYYGDLNADGDCDDTVLLDAQGDAVTETLPGTFVKTLSPWTPAVPFWEAGQVLKAGSSQKWRTRSIYTLIDSNRDGKLDQRDTPIAFTEANASFLREYLGISQNPTGCADLATKLGFVSLTPDDCARVIIRWYRGADALNPDPALRDYDRASLLQDLAHSTPINVEPPLPKDSCALSPQCLPTLFQGATALETGYPLQTVPGTGDAYDKYVDAAGGRDKVVLVGSNGGMLHAFLNGRSTGRDPATGRGLYDAGTGQELWAFIPPDTLPRLKGNLDKHAPLVNGTAMVRDVWLDGVGGPSDGRKQWEEYRTVAVIGTGRGGVHRFALDLTRLLGQATGEAVTRAPDQQGDFLWMWPQPCDPLALQVGESFSNFAPLSPPIGPVALTPGADDALRVRNGQPSGMAETPWMVSGTAARERWVVALNGGYDPYNNRGRGMAVVDLASGHTVWSFFNGDNQGRSSYLRYSMGAGLALADVGQAYGSGVENDGLFDTATVGDYGGQLWAVRFWKPGQWDAATQRVNNWYAARAFRTENLAGRSGSAEALRSPFSQIATNVVQPDMGILRTFIGTGDSQNLYDTGTRCRMGNPRACAEQGCTARATLEVQRGGMLASTASTTYANYSLASTASSQAPAYGSCASSKVKLTWDNDAANGCSNGYDGALEYTCDGTSSTWSCRTTVDSWVTLNFTQQATFSTQRFYGVWSYGGSPWRTFDSEAEAQNFDFNMITDSSLLNVGQFDSAGRVVTGSELEASPTSPGWYIPYTSANERTGSPATFIDGCLLWSSFEPSSQSATVCSTQGTHISRLYQASPVSGRASCATGFYDVTTSTWSRYFPTGTSVNLGAPAPQHTQYNGQLYHRALLNTPPSASSNGTPFRSVPVTQSTP